MVLIGAEERGSTVHRLGRNPKHAVPYGGRTRTIIIVILFL